MQYLRNVHASCYFSSTIQNLVYGIFYAFGNITLHREFMENATYYIDVFYSISNITT